MDTVYVIIPYLVQKLCHCVPSVYAFMNYILIVFGIIFYFNFQWGSYDTKT